MNGDKSHHVAWADRIGLNKTWAKGIERIWATYGTKDFENAVWGLHTIIVNVNNGPQLRKIIDDFIKNKYDLIEKELVGYVDTYAYRSEREILISNMLPDFAYFMVQLLEDNGFGMYKSEYDGEYDEM